LPNLLLIMPLEIRLKVIFLAESYFH
jgi:hypothetical protein